MTGLKNHSPTDEELMNAYKMGSTEAFNILYDRYSAKVRGYLCSKSLSPAVVDDLLQQIFLKLHNKRATFDPSFLFITWIFTITKNTLTDHFRKEARNQVKETSYAEAQKHLSDLSCTEMAPQNNVLKSLLEHYEALGLTTKQVHLLKLKFESDLNYEEMARLTQSNPTNIRQIISRSLRKIKDNYKSVKELNREKNNS